jgi:hypothetical protein
MSLRNNSVWASFFVGAVVGGLCISWLWSDPRPAQAAERLSLASIDARLFALETLLADVTLDQNGDLVIEGVNLHIRSGTGATDGEVNGRGNLIVGYDEEDPLSGSEKSGSHNIVVGSEHTYTSYGGMVVGTANEILAPYASVSGGGGNTASGFVSSISGGSGNTASGILSSVSGGVSNTASNIASSVSGGNTNTASGNGSSVSGGFRREATESFNWRAGSLLESQ